jgi:hypothetical protein
VKSRISLLEGVIDCSSFTRVRTGIVVNDYRKLESYAVNRCPFCSVLSRVILQR